MAPSSDQRSLWMSMARLVRHLAHGASLATEKAEGVSLSEMTLLGQVRALGGSARMVDLADRLQVSRAAITKIVDSLEGSGLLERGPDDSDRRVVRIRLSSVGGRVLGRAEKVFEDFMHLHFWGHLSDGETADMAKILNTVEHLAGIAGKGVLPP